MKAHINQMPVVQQGSWPESSLGAALHKKSKKIPRACPVEFHVYCYLALNVNLHGTSPWHPVFIAETIGVATNASLHGTRPWHLRLFVQSLSRPHSPCTANSLWSWTFE